MSKSSRPLLPLRSCLSAVALAVVSAAAFAAPAPWQADLFYRAGDLVSYNGKVYRALVNQVDYSSTGWNPLSADLWTPVAGTAASQPPTQSAVPSVTTTTTTTPPPTNAPSAKTSTTAPTDCPPWEAGATYVGGQFASINGQAFRANWWTQANPAQASGLEGSGQPWTAVGACKAAVSVPAAPKASTSAPVPTQATPFKPSTSSTPSLPAANKTPVSPQSPPTSSTSSSGSVPATSTADTVLMGYFPAWGIYGRDYRVRNMETAGIAGALTHVNYAFANVRNNRCEVGVNQPSNEDTGEGGDAYADYSKIFQASESVDGVADTWNQPLRGNWNQFKKLKAKYPKLKVLMSLGGWTWSRGFSDAALPANRAAFVKSCVDAFIKGNIPSYDNAGGDGAALGVFDGIDIDWEHPNACGIDCSHKREQDRENFTALLAEFRKQLDAVRPGLLLTVAVGAGVDVIAKVDPDKYSKHVDFINLMSYDFHGAWEASTGFQSALYAGSNTPYSGDATKYDSDSAIRALLDKGVPANKINLGIGFYGRGWTDVPNVGNGLYQATKPVERLSSTGKQMKFGGTPAKGTYEWGIEDYKVLKNLTGYASHVDPVSRAHWIFNGSTFWSFDTPVQIKEKMDYVKQKGLRGAFAWDLTGDDESGTLMKAMRDGLKK